MLGNDPSTDILLCDLDNTEVFELSTDSIDFPLISSDFMKVRHAVS